MLRVESVLFYNCLVSPYAWVFRTLLCVQTPYYEKKQLKPQFSESVVLHSVFSVDTQSHKLPRSTTKKKTIINKIYQTTAVSSDVKKYLTMKIILRILQHEIFAFCLSKIHKQQNENTVIKKKMLDTQNDTILTTSTKVQN